MLSSYNARGLLFAVALAREPAPRAFRALAFTSPSPMCIRFPQRRRQTARANNPHHVNSELSARRVGGRGEGGRNYRY